MAKRKLSAEQRAKLRAELAQGVKAKTPIPELLETISKKYGITTITARWYLKSIGVKPKRRKGQPGRPPGSNGLSGLKAMHSRALKTIARAKEAKRLYPRWRKLVQRGADLERELGKLDRKLKRVSKRATQMKDRIVELVDR